ncbi:uncharacterized protein PFLUO_LOCUS893 [Penicillium psychrofluorescens]|uniref:uncharacterized protein n=1 Tax=Penicillium psychrofluorescens TaxID=3158075 RepID=UPI003CCC9078
MRSKSVIRAVLPLLLSLGASVEASSPANNRVRQGIRRHTDSATNSSQNVYQTDFPGVTWNEDNWLLTTTNIQQGIFQARGSVANGYLGINVASAGPFFEVDTPQDGDVISGWPLFSTRQTFATIAGFWDSQPTTNGSNFPWLYQYGGDSVISGIPHWSGIVLDLGGDSYLDATVDSSAISNFRSTYDFKAGILLWSYQWTPKGNNGSYQITYRLFANKLYVNQAVVDMEIIPSTHAEGEIVNVLDGLAAVRTDFVESGQDDGAIFSAVRPNGINNVTAYVYANLTTSSSGVDLTSRKLVRDRPYVNQNASSIAESVPVKLSPGQAVRITKYVGAASTDAFADPKQTAKQASYTALTNGYSKSLRSHIAEWANIMPEDSVDRYSFPGNGSLPADSNIIDSAIIAVANTYYLLQNTAGQNAIKAASGAPINDNSISVGGLTSDSYAGQVFWDADVWMQPGIAASHPESAQRITNYRVAKYEQAKANIKTAFTSSQNHTTFSPNAAAFPWTSARFGNCTATGPCWDYEYHLNGDIGISLTNQWVASGDTQGFKEKLFPIYDSVATLYADLLVQNGSSWTLKNMTDPDEYANNVDAGGYTMPLIAETLMHANAFHHQFGLPQNETWNQMASNVLVIRENGITLEFTTMNGSALVKQADVVLNTYPLDYSSNYTTLDSLNDLDYYANKQSPDGPAMTWAIFSIVASEVSPSGCSAYTYAQYSYKPYARAPFFQLSEQLVDDATLNGGTHPAFPFLTGHGGANQVGVFGYLGLRLLPDNFLHIDPNLPPQIPYLRYRTFYWRGWPISAWSNYTHTTISRSTTTSPLDTADQRFGNQTIQVHSGPGTRATVYKLPVKGSVVIPNRQIGSQNTVAGNLVQCQPVQSSDAFEPGQFPISLVDGASSTKWQPSFAANMSSVTVPLPGNEVGSMVSGFFFDWAQAPPVNATVIFHNKTIHDPASVYASSTDRSDYTVITSLSEIKQSNPYNTVTTNLDAVVIPTGNTTNVTLSSPVPAARYASLLIVGNQALSPVDVQAKNGTGATVAEWAIIGQNQQSQSNSGNTKRAMNWRAMAAAAGSDGTMRQRRQALPLN